MSPAALIVNVAEDPVGDVDALRSPSSSFASCRRYTMATALQHQAALPVRRRRRTGSAWLPICLPELLRTKVAPVPFELDPATNRRR